MLLYCSHLPWGKFVADEGFQLVFRSMPHERRESANY